jgi:tetratricopeptide (TPR) repeat protein
MFKKILSVVNILLFVSLIVIVLDVFGIIQLPFFNQGEEQVTEEPLKFTVDEDETDGDKVPRKKSYAELIKTGDIYLEKGFYNLAIDAYNQAFQTKPGVDPLLRIAKIHLLSQNFDQVKETCLEALKVDNNNATAKLLLGRANLGLQDVTNAKSIFDSVSPANDETLYYQGITALYFGQYNDGLNKLNSALSIAQTQTLKDNIQKFIDALNEFNRYQAGVEIFRKTLIARSYVQADEPFLAIPLLFEVIKEKRDYRDAWIILGYSYLKTENYEDAIDALNEAKNLDPNKPHTYFFLGIAYAGKDNIDEAIKNLEYALEYGYEPKIHIEQKLAELYLKQDDYESSVQKYENVIALNSSDVNYFIRPIWIYIDKLNQSEKATYLAEKAILHHPEEAMSYNLLGWAQIANDDLLNAKENLEKALTMDRELDAAYLNLGWLHEKQGNNELAKNYYKQAFNLGKGNAVATLAGQKYNNILNQEQTGLVNIFN